MCAWCGLGAFLLICCFQLFVRGRFFPWENMWRVAVVPLCGVLVRYRALCACPCVAWARLLGLVVCDGQTLVQNTKHTCDMPAVRVGVARLAYAHLGVCVKSFS